MKLNSITEGKLHITEISLRSGLSDDVKFVYDIDTAVNHPFGNRGWWSDYSTSISDLAKSTKKDGLIQFVGIAQNGQGQINTKLVALEIAREKT